MEVSRMYITGWADLGENPSLADKKAFIAEVEGAFPCIEGLSMFPIVRAEYETDIKRDRTRSCVLRERDPDTKVIMK